MRFKIQYKNGTQVIVKPDHPETFIATLTELSVSHDKLPFHDTACFIVSVDILSISVYEAVYPV